jgi:hypothetical protein
VVPPEERAALDDAHRRINEPLRVAIAGRVKAGKSTLLNALVGEELAPTDASECTRIVTWYRYGLTYEVLAHLHAGGTTPLPFGRADRAVTVELGDVDAADINHLEVRWPSGRLEPMTLIDTPGIESVTVDVATRAHDFIDPEDGEVSGADALLYLMPHTHPGDARMLEAFQDEDLGRGTPVNAVGVLSRADEIGGCRIDALETATAAAQRCLALPELRQLCLTVVPVAGLVAQAAATLEEHEFRWLANLSQLSAQDLATLLLTADRFGEDRPVAGVSGDERQQLLDRIGIFGIRISVDAIRTRRVTTSGALASELLTHSGLPVLQSLLATHFAGRSRVLKAHTALVALDRALRDRAGDARVDALLRDAERLRASEHEFTEMRVLSALRSRELQTDPARRAELERILGGEGDAPFVRLGLSPEATNAEILAAASEQLGRWRRLADHPLTGRALVDAASAAVRSCEGMLATVSAPAPVPGGGPVADEPIDTRDQGRPSSSPSS